MEQKKKRKTVPTVKKEPPVIIKTELSRSESLRILDESIESLEKSHIAKKLKRETFIESQQIELGSNNSKLKWAKDEELVKVTKYKRKDKNKKVEKISISEEGNHVENIKMFQMKEWEIQIKSIPAISWKEPKKIKDMTTTVNGRDSTQKLHMDLKVKNTINNENETKDIVPTYDRKNFYLDNSVPPFPMVKPLNLEVGALQNLLSVLSSLNLPNQTSIHSTTNGFNQNNNTTIYGNQAVCKNHFTPRGCPLKDSCTFLHSKPQSFL
jgi:hypothetical protein